MLLWVGFGLIVLAEAIALYSVKYSQVHADCRWLVLSVVGYMVIPLLLWLILQHHGQHIATVNITWNILSTLYGLAIGVLLFQEKLKNLQWYGAILGVLSLVLIFYDR